MTDWHPSWDAKPVEWEMRMGFPSNPIAVIRELRFPAGNYDDVYYRAVTWSPSSEGRELIGYWPTMEAAAEAAWDHHRLVRDARAR